MWYPKQRSLRVALIAMGLVGSHIAIIPEIADAQRRGGGGGRGGGARGGGGGRSMGGAGRSMSRPSGGSRASYGGHNRSAARSSINHRPSTLPSRGYDNRNVNRNVNRDVNRNVNRNVDGYRGGYGNYGIYGDVDRNWHPVARGVAWGTAAAVTAAAIGSTVYSLPSSCTTVVVDGVSYHQCGSSWYEPQFVGTSVSYEVVSPP